jgi:hypothetical protein
MIKRLKSRVRKAYNRRKLGIHYMEELKQLTKQLLSAKISAQEPFLKSILSKKCNCWSEFQKYLKRCNGSTENIPAIKDCNGRIITDPTEKDNLLNLYYSTVFSIEGNIPQIQGDNTDN